MNNEPLTDPYPLQRIIELVRMKDLTFLLQKRLLKKQEWKELKNFMKKNPDNNVYFLLACKRRLYPFLYSDEETLKELQIMNSADTDKAWDKFQKRLVTG